MNGHIQLGATADDLYDYLLVDPGRYQKTLSNPFAAKLATGAGKYDDLENWAAWVMEDWQGGIGRSDAADGGMLYADVDSRVPKQLILPTMPDLGTDYTDLNYIHDFGDGMNVFFATTFDNAIRKTLPSGAQTQLAWKTSPRVTFTTRQIEIGVLMLAQPSSTMTLKIHADNSGEPGTLLYTLTRMTQGRGGVGWQMWSGSSVTLTSGTTYWLVLTHTAGTAVTVIGNAGSGTLRGPTWASETGAIIYNMMSGPRLANIAEFNGTVYGNTGQALHKWDATDGRWESVGATADGPNRVQGMVEFDGKLYMGKSIAGGYYTCTTGDVIASTALDARGFAVIGGYLWRWWGNNLYYSADASTWSSAVVVGSDTETIQSVASLRGEVYAATDFALYQIAAGDAVLGVTRVQGGVVQMREHNGSLYIVADGGRNVLLFDGSGMQDILRMEQVGDKRLGYVARLESTNNWLLALLADGQAIYPTAGSAKILAWQTEGWHVLSTLPLMDVNAFVYQYSARKLWVGGYGSAALLMADSTHNPYYSTLPSSANMFYMPFGWLETSWFDGDLLDVDKDWESVFIVGEFADDDYTGVDVYWRTSADDEWTLLGEITSSGGELRWTTRPTGKRIQLGLQLWSEYNHMTPRVQAVRVKYMPMVRDRWRWQLPIGVHERQQMLDGTINVQSAAEMLEHLDTLIMQTTPVHYVDVDGTAYECKVLAASQNIQRFEYIDGAARVQWVVSVTLEQVN